MTTQAVNHGKLAFDAPSGWADETTIVYTAPLAEGIGAALAGRVAPSYRSNVTVSVERRSDKLATPEAFLESLGEVLRAAGIQAADLGVRPFNMGGRPGTIAERRLKLDDKILHQWTAVVYLEVNVIVATASTLESVATKDEAMLLQLLASIRHA